MTQENLIYFQGIGEISYESELERELLLRGLKRYIVTNRGREVPIFEILMKAEGYVGFGDKSYLVCIRNGKFHFREDER